MKVILKDNIENLGKRGDIVNVAAGFGRNYLLPKKLALLVTKSNMKMIELEQIALRKKLEIERSSYQETIDSLNKVTLTFYRKVGEKESLFGSVNISDIKEELEASGFDIERKKILLDEPIKKTGQFVIPVKVFHDDKAEIKIEVKEEKTSEKKTDLPKINQQTGAEAIPVENDKLQVEPEGEIESNQSEAIIEPEEKNVISAEEKEESKEVDKEIKKDQV